MGKYSLSKGIQNAFFNLKWRCNVCDKENFNGDYFCNECLNSLPIIKEYKCEHCGRLTAYSTNYCDSCIEKNINFDKARSLFSYEEPIDTLIQNLKYNSKLYLAEIFADLFVESFLTNFPDTDYITFVPSTKKTIKERGYNQSEILADKLSEKTGIKVLSTAKKVKDTERQATLNAEERRKNLQGVFKINDVDIKGKNLLIVDDVLTTGTTVDVFAKLLKKKKVCKVYVLTVASVSKTKFKSIKNSENI